MTHILIAIDFLGTVLLLMIIGFLMLSIVIGTLLGLAIMTLRLIRKIKKVVRSEVSSKI